MKCELRKMGSDVKKSIILKNIIDAVKMVVGLFVLALLFVLGFIYVAAWRLGRDGGHEAFSTFSSWLPLFIALLIVHGLYTWYKQSHEWCNDRGEEDVM